jgi:hypothetical protein
MTTKKTHPADVADHALIADCKKFTATILKDNKPQTTEHPTLEAARIEAARLDATSNNGRKALVYAITAEDRAILVPASWVPVHSPELAAAAKAVAEKKPAKPAKAAKPAKPAAEKKAKAKPAKTAKPAKAKAAKKSGGSKVEIVIAMLTGKKAVTRKDITEATEWPSINIKAICARKGMKLKQAADGTLSASAPK